VLAYNAFKAPRFLDSARNDTNTQLLQALQPVGIKFPKVI
jgi:hypothetical protein